MKKRKKGDLKQEVFDLYDDYAHNKIQRRDFVKKLLGRIVCLYFLQKKGWLGASSINYTDGDKNFISNFFKEAKQLLGLGKCQSNDFDAQIADATITSV